MTNVYAIYVCITKFERDYFNKILLFLEKIDKISLQLVLLNFKYNAKVNLLAYNNVPIKATFYNYHDGSKEVSEINITNLESISKIYTPKYDGLNVFLYSGHGNGLHLVKNKIKILRTEDIAHLCWDILKQKADLIVFDCCLEATISTLNICYNYTKYLVATSSYHSYESYLMTQSIYKSSNNDIIEYSISFIEEFIQTEQKNKKDTVSSINLYQMNETVPDFVNMVMKYKDSFKAKKSFVIDKTYYKDLECAFKELGINILPILQKFVIYQRLHKDHCINRIRSKMSNKSNPSNLMIVLKNPIRDISSLSDIWLKRFSK